MATKAQQQDEMVNTFVASIPTMQTDIALLKQDTSFLKVASATQNSKSDTIIESLGKLSVVSKADFEAYKKEEVAHKTGTAEAIDKRFKLLEAFNEEHRPGIKFANALVSRWTTFLILLLLTAAVIALVGRFIPVGSVGV